jgi:hypothetical protein
MKLLTLLLAVGALTVAQPSFAKPQALQLDSPQVQKAVKLFAEGAIKNPTNSEVRPIVLPSDNPRGHKQLDGVLIMGGGTAVPM